MDVSCLSGMLFAQCLREGKLGKNLSDKIGKKTIWKITSRTKDDQSERMTPDREAPLSRPPAFELLVVIWGLMPKYCTKRWESANVLHKRVFALLRGEKTQLDMAEVLQEPVFALPGCQQISVN